MYSNNIADLLYRIKDDIRAIENGDIRESLLDEVRSDFLDLIELIKLFLISERDSYYGYFLMNMQFRANFFSNSIAGIKLNEFPPVFEANPLLLCKFKLKEIIYIVCHEIDHVVFNHPAEMLKANPEGDPDTFYQFNLAADAAVNDRIDHEIVSEKHEFMAGPDGLITSPVLSKMFKLGNIRPMENYAYYFDLIRKKRAQQQLPKDQQNGKKGAGNAQNGQQSKEKQDTASDQNEQQSNQEQQGPGNARDGRQGKKEQQDAGSNRNGQQSIMEEQNRKDGNASSGDHNEGKREQNHQKDQGDSKADAQGKNGSEAEANNDNRLVTAANCGNNISDHNWEAGNDADDAAAAVREFVNASVGMMNNESRGLMPGYFMSQVEDINKPAVLSWQAILKKYVGTVTANKRKTRMRLNRRQPERFDLSGTVDDKVLKIVVAIDTSGSMSDTMIGQVMNEIFAILAKRKHDITIIECDAEVRRVYKAKTPADIKKKVIGRGGTWFSPVIDYINKDKYFRDALLIYFTDGFGENEIPKPRTYRNIWVVIHDARHLSVKETYGIVLTL